jgi:hypothetical protein
MKRSLILFGVIALSGLLLAAGAYTTAHLLVQPEPARPGSGGARVMQSVQVGNDGVPVSVQTTILPAAELPDDQPVAAGIVLRRQDDTLMLGTGDIELAVEVEVDAATGRESSSVVPSTSGPELEVVLTRDTLLYRDVTDVAGQQPEESGEVIITQELRPVGDTDEIRAQMEAQVWGERRGERVVAEVVVFGPLAGGAFD